MTDGGLRVSLARLWSQRALVFALTERALKARYRGSVLGVLWSLINPLLLLLVYTLVFRYVFQPRIGAAPEPYALFLFTGLLPWTWLVASLTEASLSIVDGGVLLRKISFPAEVLPLVAVLSNGVHFLVAVPVLLAFLEFSGPGLGPWALAAPLATAVQGLYVTGLALALAALGVRYRDVRDLLGHALTLWFFSSPVLYQLEGLPQGLRKVVALNPMSAVFATYHDTLFFGREPDWRRLGVMAAIGLLVLVVGYLLLDRMRSQLAEEV